MDNLKNLLKRLCEATGVSGGEGEISALIRSEMEEYSSITTDRLGNVICELKNENYVPEGLHIMLDAHIDSIGFIVTSIEKSGFLRFASVGGNDCRILASSEVTVYGKEPLFGIIISTPPHLNQGSDGDAKAVDKLYIDTGLSFEEVSKRVSPGDRILVKSSFTELFGNRVSCAALDDRAAVACLMLAAEMLRGKKYKSKITCVFSSCEEVGGQGAKTAAFALEPDEAISVDVSYATSPGVGEEKASSLGGGVIIAYYPSLSFEMSDEMKKAAALAGIPFSVEVGGGDVGSNADLILDSRGGVRTSALFIPERNMHSPVEIVELSDIENTAKLIVEYVLSREGGNHDV